MREHHNKLQRSMLRVGLGLVCTWFLCTGAAMAQVPPPASSTQALQSQLRGVTQMVLQLRRDMAKMKREHASSLKALKKQHASALQQLRSQAQGQPDKAPKAPARGQSIAALQRRMKVLSHQIEGLRQEVRRNKRNIGTRTQPPGQRFVPPQRARGTRPPAVRWKRSVGKRRLHITGREYANGFYMLTFQVGYQARRIEYKLSHMKRWRSTGMTHVRNPVTGQPYPQTYIMTRHLKQGRNQVSLRIQRSNRKWTKATTHIVTIKPKSNSDADLFMRYQWNNPIMRQVRYRQYRGQLWFMFFWASSPKIFKSASYSFGTPSLHNHFIRNGKKKKNSAIIRRNMTPGRYTLYARFKLVNGTYGPLLTYPIHVKNDGRWYNGHP